MAVSISGSGQVPVQVAQAVKSDTFTFTSTTYVDVTGLTVNITPTNSANKILVIANVNHVGATSTGASAIRLVRNSTAIGVGDTAGSRTLTSGGYNFGNYGVTLSSDAVCFLDSPATTSSTTYKIQILCYSGAGYVNRSQVDTDSSVYTRSISSITVMEISGT